MPQPEISHRCSSCGASVREANALFCPECGKPLAESEAKSEPENSETSAVAEVTAEKAANEQEPKPPPANLNIGASAHPHRIGDKTRERLHRASEVARGVI